uniref:Uncharacterized protein n=1 Tax=Oryza meridionalis TaxID=40149 RepID=A0A0E0E5Q5_9ORYZ
MTWRGGWGKRVDAKVGPPCQRGGFEFPPFWARPELEGGKAAWKEGKPLSRRNKRVRPAAALQEELIRRAKRRLAGSPLQLRAVVGGGALSVLAGGSREPSALCSNGSWPKEAGLWCICHATLGAS